MNSASRRAFGARASLRPDADAAGRNGAPDLLERRRRQAAARRAHVPLGAHDRDAARGRNGAGVARRSGHRQDGAHGRQGAATRGRDRRDRGAAGHALLSLPGRYHYRVDENDLTTYCNLIVSTTNNNQAMNEAIRAVASRYLSGHELAEGLLNNIEVAIRAYDPCLSCATHALGQMPLEVDLVDADGALVSRARKG